MTGAYIVTEGGARLVASPAVAIVTAPLVAVEVDQSTGGWETYIRYERRRQDAQWHAREKPTKRKRRVIRAYRLAIEASDKAKAEALAAVQPYVAPGVDSRVPPVEAVDFDALIKDRAAFDALMHTMALMQDEDDIEALLMVA